MKPLKVICLIRLLTCEAWLIGEDVGCWMSKEAGCGMGNDTAVWTEEPENKAAFTAEFDDFYTTVSSGYDRLIKLLPFWRRWLDSALPWIEGPRVLEVGTGTGYLLTRYAAAFDAYGVDINAALLVVAQENLRHAGLSAKLQRASVEALPYPRQFFNTVLSTMAFTGFPDGEKALSEMTRVLKEDGKLVLVDVSLPLDGNLLGTAVARAFEAGGDILRDMGTLLSRYGFQAQVDPVGGFGSIQRIVAWRRVGDQCPAPVDQLPVASKQ